MSVNYERPAFDPKVAEDLRKPSKLDRVVREKKKDRAEAKAWDECAKAVDARDRKVCRCCGRKASPDAATLLERMHRHHITSRRHKATAYEPANVVSLCAWCHGAEHGGQLFIIGDDANDRLEFEVVEAAVVDIFGARVLPAHVHIVLPDGARKVS